MCDLIYICESEGDLTGEIQKIVDPDHIWFWKESGRVASAAESRLLLFCSAVWLRISSGRRLATG